MRFEQGYGVNTTGGILCIVGCCVYVVLVVVLLLLFLKRRQKRLVQIREPLLLSCAVVYGAVLVCVTGASVVVGKTPAMCEALGIVYQFYLPFWSLPYLLMLPTIVFENKLNNLKIRRGEGIKSWHWNIRWLFKTKAKAIMMLGFTVIQFAVYIGLRYGLTFPGGEEGDGSEGECIRKSLLAITILILFYFSFLGYFAMKLFSVSDPYFMKFEIMIVLACLAPLTIITILFPIIPQYFPQQFDFRLIPCLAIFSGLIITVLFPILLSIPSVENAIQNQIFKWRGFATFEQSFESEDIQMKKFLPENLEIFRSVLDNAELLGAFTEFCVKNWSVENVLFYKEVEGYRNDYPTFTEDQRRTKCLFIESEYIRMGSPLEINIDFGTRRQILFSISQKNISQDIFDLAQKHVYELMKKDSFAKWQRVPDFKIALHNAIKVRKSSSSLFQSFQSMVEHGSSSKLATQRNHSSDTFN